MAILCLQAQCSSYLLLYNKSPPKLAVQNNNNSLFCSQICNLDRTPLDQLRQPTGAEGSTSGWLVHVAGKLVLMVTQELSGGVLFLLHMHLSLGLFELPHNMAAGF